MLEITKVSNPDPDPVCNCPDMLHNDHLKSECTSGCKCDNCGMEFFYKFTKVIYMTDFVDTMPVFVCPDCEHQTLSIWNNAAQANECYPDGCTCGNNEDYCPYCEMLLDNQSAREYAVDRVIGRVNGHYILGNLSLEEATEAANDLYDCRKQIILERALQRD